VKGVLLVDKPSGPTSHDVVNRLRRLTGEKRVGHAGALDPFATGLLVTLVGAATKLSGFLLEQDKAYDAVVQWGAATDTLDRDGQAVETCDGPLPDRAATAAALAGLVGEFVQEPPMYSAKKVGGRPLHRLARQGKVVEREAKPVTIRALELLAHDPAAGTFAFRVRCAKGTYVRALADALARRLGGVGHLRELRRTASGRFTVAQAATLEQLAEPGELARRLLPLEAALADFPGAALTAEASRALGNGHRPASHAIVACDGFRAGQVVRLAGPGGELLAVARALVDASRVAGLETTASPFELLRVFAAEPTAAGACILKEKDTG
jgi:tRNA pseudouridine55 synthase